MKILKVEIENYRQYKGKNTVNMSIDPDKNITIIQADNGVGKSNFMNAIIWCLYNDEIFKSKKNEGRSIVNESALQELEIGESIDVQIAITLGDSIPKYKFERRETFTRYVDGYSSNSKKFLGYEINSEKGWSNISNPEWIIDRKFIPRDLLGFFFFDGEKMESYFEDTSKVKNNVEKIAQIDVLKSAVKTLSDVKNEIMRDIGKHKPDQNIDIEMLDSLKEEIQKLEYQKTTVMNEANEKEKELKDVDEYLKNNSDILVREIQDKIELIEREQKTEAKKLQDNETAIRDFIKDRAPILLSLDALSYSEKLIEAETEKGVLPPDIKDVFLKDLLTKGICICGRSLDKGDEYQQNVEKLLEELMPNDISMDATTGKYMISGMLDKKNFKDDYGKYLTNRMKIENNLEKLSEKLTYASNKLKNYDEIEISEKANDRERLNQDIKRMSVRKGVIGNQIVEKNKEYDKLEKVIDEKSSMEKHTSDLTKQKNYAMMLENLFKNMEESIVDDVRLRLEEKTREYFFNMIWKKEAFSDVQIIDSENRYRISIKTEYGRECLGDISAGEKQVLALAFTAALYSVSGYSVPVIIDTPLARISGAPRENIAKLLPNYLSDTQIIMLLTDTEYTKAVRDAMSKNVGIEYMIQHDEKTKISKVMSYV